MTPNLNSNGPNEGRDTPSNHGESRLALDDDDVIAITCNTLMSMLHTVDLDAIYRDASNARTSERRMITRATNWDSFRGMFDEIPNATMKTAVAEMQPEDSIGTLLHAVCTSNVPLDVVDMLIEASDKPVCEESGNGLRATPLHFACFFGGSAEVIQLLINSDPNKRTITWKDINGRVPLHQICMSGAGYAAPSIVDLLLEADSDKRTLLMRDTAGHYPLQSACLNGSPAPVIERIIDACLDAGKSPDNTPTLAKVQDQLPLHAALEHGASGDVVECLLGANTNATKTNRRLQTPMHLAFLHNVHSSVFEALLNADETWESFRMTDCCKETPFDVFMNRMNEGDISTLKTISAFAEADESRRFFRTKDSHGKTPLDALLANFASASLSHLQKQILYIVLACTPPNSGEYRAALAKCKSKLGEARYDRLYSDRRFHRTLNTMMTRRTFTTSFMLDLYSRIFLVAMFTLTGNAAIEPNISHTWQYVCLYATTMYLISWQVQLISSHELLYFSEPWNILDLTTQILVLVSSALLQSGVANNGSMRALTALTGGLVWTVVMLSALRSTFLPFSVFVSAMMNIILRMIPFTVTTFLLLGAFADMYYRSTVNTSECDAGSLVDFCNYNTSFLKVYSMFVNGVDSDLLTVDTSNNLLALSVMFAFWLTIVLVTVLVAVIFDAWGEVAPQGRKFFWRHRHQFLMETNENAMSQVFRGFPSESLDAIDRHVCKVIETFLNRPTRVLETKDRRIKLHHHVLYFLEALYLLWWFIVGLLSVGALWPTPLRFKLFAMLDNEAPDDVVSDAMHGPTDVVLLGDGLVQIKRQLEATQDRIESTNKELSNMKDTIAELKEIMLQIRDTATIRARSEQT